MQSRVIMAAIGAVASVASAFVAIHKGHEDAIAKQPIVIVAAAPVPAKVETRVPDAPKAAEPKWKQDFDRVWKDAKAFEPAKDEAPKAAAPAPVTPVPVARPAEHRVERKIAHRAERPAEKPRKLAVHHHSPRPATPAPADEPNALQAIWNAIKSVI